MLCFWSMAAIERFREFLTGIPEATYFQQKTQAGWRLVSVEWERDVSGAPGSFPTEEVPYGLEVAGDCQHLQENSLESAALARVMELIVQDRPLPEVAEELNHAGYKTRSGGKWTAPAIFDLLPRLIEAGPKIFNDKDYVARKSLR